MKRDPSTYGGVSKKFDEWQEIQASKPPVPRVTGPQRPYTPEPEESSDMGKMVFNAIGVGIGLVLLALAAFAFVTAAKWNGLDRDSAYVGYSLVGFFLLIAGLGGIAATLNHNLRVLARPASHH